MIGSLVVVVVILGCAAYQFLKGTIVKAFATIIIAVCASAVAFGYFELLANLIISRGGEGRFAALVPWAHPLCFVLLFVLAFALLQTAAGYLMRQPVDLGLWPERIGRVICGIFLGLIISGIFLIALAMAPLPNKYPYQRYEERSPDAERPSKVLLNADGLTAGWFSMMSNGSLRAISNPRSFATLHPKFVDQLYLGRHNISDGISAVTMSESIEVPRKGGAWYAPEDIKDSSGTIAQKSGHNLTIVRLGIKRSAGKNASEFTLSQLRLICKAKTDSENPFTGKAQNIYPAGYLKAAKQLQERKLNHQIKIDLNNFTETVKWIDFAFYVPSDAVGVALEFKLNNIAEVPAPVSAEQAQPVTPFIEQSEGERPPSEAGSSKQPSTGSGERTQDNSGGRGLSNISKGILGPQFDEQK